MACLVDLSCVEEDTKERERLIDEAFGIAGGAEMRIWKESQSAESAEIADSALYSECLSQ